MQFYWCVNCGKTGDFGFDRKKSVRCDNCSWDDLTEVTKGEFNRKAALEIRFPGSDVISLEKVKERK